MNNNCKTNYISITNSERFDSIYNCKDSKGNLIASQVHKHYFFLENRLVTLIHWVCQHFLITPNNGYANTIGVERSNAMVSN